MFVGCLVLAIRHYVVTDSGLQAFDENSQPVTTGALRLRFDPPIWVPPPIPVCDAAKSPLACYTDITEPGGSTIGDQAHILTEAFKCGYQYGINYGYGNFDIIFDHFPRSLMHYNDLHAPCAVIYLGPMLIVC